MTNPNWNQGEPVPVVGGCVKTALMLVCYLGAVGAVLLAMAWMVVHG